MTDTQVVGQLVEKKVNLGKETSVFVKVMPAIESRRFVMNTQSDDIETRLKAGYSQIQKSICNEDGLQKYGSITEAVDKITNREMAEYIRVFSEVHTAKDEDLGNG